MFVGGSFVTAKPDPGDFDVAWDMVGVDADALDPIFFDFEDERAAQKRRFPESSSRRSSLRELRVDRFSSFSSTRVTMSLSRSSRSSWK